jgi:hypothetical protein
VAGRYAAVAYGGSTLFGYDNGYPVPLLNSARGRLNNINAMPATGGAPEYTPQTSFQRKGGGKIDFKMDFDGATCRS